MAASALALWMDYMKAPSAEGLDQVLAEDVTFWSPIVHTPQRGRAITKMYLMAADQVLAGPDFRYVRTFDAGDRAVLEFETLVDGKTVNGVDMIELGPDGKIIDFKVMVRPLQAVNAVHAQMMAMLERMKG